MDKTTRRMAPIALAALTALGTALPAYAALTINVDAGTFGGDTARYNAAVASMQAVINRYNVYGDFGNYSVYAYYNAGIPTAQAGYVDYGGSIGYGGTYPNERVTQHESNHYFGSGTYWRWEQLFDQYGGWTGSKVSQLIQQFDGDGARIYRSGVHFYGYGLNYDSEVNSDSIYMRNVAIMYAMRQDMGNGNQANPWSATNVTLTASDPAGRSAFNWFGGGYSGNYQGWNDKYFAHAGAAYSTGAFDIRTPEGTAGWTFAGDSLTINTGGRLLYNSYLAAGKITINNLILAGGTVRHDQFPADLFRLAGNGITVTANSTFEAANGNIIVNPAIGGAGGLTFAGNYTTTLNGINTFTGGITVNSGTLAINAGGAAGGIRGTLNINSGATVKLNAADALGYGTGTSVTQVNVNGGTLDNAAAGSNGYNAIFALTGGTVRSSGGGALHINPTGGAAITSLASANTSTIGGKLVIRGANSVLPINVADGTAASDLVISGGIANSTIEPGANGITKTGAGTLVLSGANTYTGPTTITAGTVAFTSAQSNVGALAVANSANLRVAAVAANTPTLTSTALTLGTTGSTSLLLDLASYDLTSPLISTGAFTANGTVNVSLQNGGALTTGFHPLVGYTSFAGAATFAATPINLGPRSTGTLVNNGTSALGITVVADRPVWTGGDNTSWTTAVTGANKNWKLQTAASATDYLQGDNVLFDDTALGSTAVNIAGANVTPAAVTFNNTAKAYSVSSSGGYGIAGTGAVVKNGTNTLTINSANSYSGGTTVNAGRLIAGNAAALGSGGLKLNAAAFGSTTPVSVAGPLSNSGASTIGYAGQNGNITLNGLAGSGTLTNFVGSASNYNVIFNGDLGNFTGTLNYTCDSGAGTGWWRFGTNNGTSNLAGAAVVLNKGNVTDLANAFSKNFGFVDGVTGAKVNLGSLSGDGVFQAAYNNAGPNTLAVGFLNTDTTFSGVIAGGAAGANLALVKTGTGMLTLTGTNLHTAGTTINAGTLAIGSDDALGVNGGAVTLNGGTLKTTAGVVGTHVIAVNPAGGTINVSTNGQYFLNINNLLQGTGPLAVTGTGTLTQNVGNLRLGQANSYGGTLTLKQGGILEYGTGGAIATAASIVLENQGEFAVQDGVTVPNALAVIGNTNSVLSFENGTTGNFAGAINLANGATLTVGLRDWYNNANARAGTVSGVISGGGNLAVNSGTATTPGTLNLTAANTFTGNMTVTNATVNATYGANDFNTNGRNNGAFGNEQTVGRTVTVNSGGTVSLAVGNVLGSGGSTRAQAPNLAFVINAGGTLSTAAANVGGTGGGDANIFGALTLNGGTLTTGNGFDANYQAAILLKDVTVGGTSASVINTNATNTAANGVMLGDSASGTDVITFNVADATGNASADLTVSARLTNSANSASNTAAVGALSKTGAGTLLLAGANSYTGTTTVKAGTLRAAAGAYNNLLTNAGGTDLQSTGMLQLDYTGGSSPVASVKSILDSGYTTGFATGKIRSTVRTAGQTLGYGDNGTDTVTVRITLAGDADLDGDVDFNDFLVLQTNFGTAGTRFDQGNFNYDGKTDFNDFLALQTNYGQSVSPDVAVAVTAEQVAALTAFATAAAVPEPASLALVGVGIGSLLRRRRNPIS